jgi:hypothetical protein
MHELIETADNFSKPLAEMRTAIEKMSRMPERNLSNQTYADFLRQIELAEAMQKKYPHDKIADMFQKGDAQQIKAFIDDANKIYLQTQALFFDAENVKKLTDDVVLAQGLANPDM